MSIYFDHGLLCGYAFDAGSDFVPDPSSVDVSASDFQLLERAGSQVTKLILSKDQEYINWSDVFEVELNGKTYYHLKGIGDGDFIGIDDTKQLYEIRHDPLEVKPLHGTVAEVLSCY